MKAGLLEGKTVAGPIKEGLKKEIRLLRDKYGSGIHLVCIRIGEDPASMVYVKSQKKTADALGIEYSLLEFKNNITQESLAKEIDKLNVDKNVTAVIVQLPLPSHIDQKKVISSISPEKDAEGMHPENLGKILLGDFSIVPCTPQAVMMLLESVKIDIYGKETVIVGHSDIVGKPLSLLLLNKFATTTVCHIATSHKGLLEEHVRRAEVLVVAVGRASLIRGEWIREGAVVIDVGINRVEGKIVGDVEFEEASKKASFITPVPGGVGPLTVTMLMKNVVNAFKLQHS